MATTAPVHLRRHDRVWLSTDDAIVETPADPRVRRWVAAGRALVVRRRHPGLPADVVPLAIALPLAEGRERIAFDVPRRAILRAAPPLTLADVTDAAPFHRRAALADLGRRSAAHATTLAVYGSFAWQAISRHACVTESSDLDLLWEARDPEHLRRMIALLLAWEEDAGWRADGEARFPDGSAVAWRELASGATRVLVKRDDGVRLQAMPAPHDTLWTMEGAVPIIRVAP